MKRINGFIDILNYYEEYFKNNNITKKITLDNLQELGLIEKSDYGSEQYWVYIDGKKYYFKRTNYPYSELVGCEIAKLLNIEVLEYDLAVLDGVNGVISPDYKKEDCLYISGWRFLYNYYIKNKKQLKEMGFESTDSEEELEDTILLNNLEVVWQAIESEFPDISKKNRIELIYGIVLQFIFMILTGQYDKGCQNWELEMSTSYVKLVSLFDMEDILPEVGICVEMTTNFNDWDNNTNVEVLKTFIEISSQEYIDLFLEKFNTLTRDMFLEILKKVENKIQSTIPPDVKNELITNFNSHRQELEWLLDDLNITNNIGRK